MTNLTELPWTVSPGSRIVRADTGHPAGTERVGTMETPELAAEAAAAHNSALAARKAAKRGVNLHGAVGVQIGDGGYQNNVF